MFSCFFRLIHLQHQIILQLILLHLPLGLIYDALYLHFSVSLSPARSLSLSLSLCLGDCVSGDRCAGVTADPHQLHLISAIKPLDKDSVLPLPHCQIVASPLVSLRFEPFFMHY